MRGFVGSKAPERPSAAIKAANRLGGAKLHKPERSAGAEASGLLIAVRALARSPRCLQSRAPAALGMKGKIRHRTTTWRKAARRNTRLTSPQGKKGLASAGRFNGPIEKARLRVAAGSGALGQRPMIFAQLEKCRLRAAGLADGFQLLAAKLTELPPAVCAAFEHEYVRIHGRCLLRCERKRLRRGRSQDGGQPAASRQPQFSGF